MKDIPLFTNDNSLGASDLNDVIVLVSEFFITKGTLTDNDSDLGRIVDGLALEIFNVHFLGVMKNFEIDFNLQITNLNF